MGNTAEAQYRREVHKALEQCQFVEGTVRDYLTRAAQIAKLKLKRSFSGSLHNEGSKQAFSRQTRQYFCQAQ